MGFKVDFSDLEKLKDALIITENEFNSFLYDFLLEMAERVIAKTKPRTPVDTGALRSAWAVETDKVTASTKTRTSKRTGQKVDTTAYSQEGNVIVSGSGKYLAVVLSNPMEYATEIEYGHRIVRSGVEVGWYEGVFMLRVSIDEIDKQMPARYEKEFKRFCKAKGLD